MSRKIIILACLLLAAGCGRSADEHVAYGKLQFEKGQYAAALESYTAALEAAPDRVELRARIAEIHLARGEYEAARRTLAELLRLRPDLLEAHELLAMSHAAQEDYDAAIDAARAAIEAVRDRAGALTLLARVRKAKHRARVGELLRLCREDPTVDRPEVVFARVDRGDLAGVEVYLGGLRRTGGVAKLIDLATAAREEWRHAFEAADQAVGLAPASVECRLVRGELLLLDGRIGDAEADLRPALDEGADAKDRRRALGLLVTVRERFGDGAGALAAAAELVALDPGNREARLKRALFLVRAGDLEAALEDARAFEQQEPGSSHGAYVTGIVRLIQGRAGDATPLLTRATRLGLPGTHMWLGLALAASGRGDVAVESLREAVRMDPSQDVAHLALAETLLGQGRIEGAIESARTATELRPDSPGAHLLLAEALLAGADAAPDPDRSAEMKDRAEAALTRLLELSPELPGGAESLALLRLSRGEFDRAALTAMDALRERPEDARLLATLGGLEVKRGNSARGEELFRRAVRADGKLPAAAVGLAEILRSEGRPEEAERILRAHLAAAPDSRPGRVVLAATLAARGRIDEADAVLLAGIRRAPDDPGLHLSRVSLLRDADRDDALLDALRDARRTAPDDPRGFDLSLVCLDRGLSEEAVRTARDGAGAFAQDPTAWALLAISLDAAGETGAIDAAGRARALAPRDHFVAALLASLHVAEGDAARIRAVLGSMPDVPDAVRRSLGEVAAAAKEDATRAAEGIGALDRAIGYHLTGRWPARAAGWAEKALEVFPRNAVALEILAVSRARSLELDAAIGALRRLLEVAPELDGARARLAELLCRRGRREKAFAELDRAWGDGYREARALILYSRLLGERGEAKRALQVAATAASVSSGNVPALLHLGLLRESHGLLEAAQRTFEQALELSPDSAPACAHLARILCAGPGRAERALELAKRAVALAPREPEARHGLALAQLRNGNVGDALTAIDKAVEFAPGNGVYLARRAEILLLLDRADEADATLADADAKGPDAVRVRLELALRAERSGDAERALRHYEAVLRADADMVPAANNAACLYARTGANLDRARELAGRAVALSRRNPATLDTLAAVELAAERPAAALPLLTEARSSAPGEPTIRYHLAKALAKLGRRGEAREELRVALASDRPFPDRGEAERLLGEVR